MEIKQFEGSGSMTNRLQIGKSMTSTVPEEDEPVLVVPIYLLEVTQIFSLVNADAWPAPPGVKYYPILGTGSSGSKDQKLLSEKKNGSPRIQSLSNPPLLSAEPCTSINW